MILFVLSGISSIIHAQSETYLNLSFHDGEHAELATNFNLMLSHEMFGVRNYGNAQHIWRRSLNENGEIELETELLFDEFQIIVPRWSDSYSILNSGDYLYSGTYFDDPSGGTFIVGIQSDFIELTWLYNLINTEEDQFREIDVVKELADGSIVGVGRNYYNIDEDNESEYATLLFVKLDQDGNELIYEETLIYDDQYVAADLIQEMPNGDLIVFGSVFHDWDNVIWRLSPDGELLNMYQWGTEDLNEWLPWAVYQGEESFVVAYQTATEIYVDPVNYSFPSLMFFDTENMEPLLVKDYENHNMLACYMHDLVKTPDNGFALMGYASYTEGPKHNFGWILKTDPLGNEEWFKTYYHEEFETFDPLNFDQLYDLEVLEDGSLIAVGSHQVVNESSESWLIKTDPCGDLIYNGCPRSGFS